MPTITRSPGLWFDDGNIVLIADKRVAFRVHRGVLTRHSSIFSDAFGLPQPGSAECYDGCPVLHISDQAADVDFLLQALYDGIRFKPIGLRAQAAFAPHAALLSLSHKYDIEHLREEAHLRIKSCFPYQFSEFRSSVRFPVVPGAGCVLRSSTLEVQASRDAIRAVNIARLIDDRRMLPMALYLCVQLPVTTLLAGIARSDPDSHCIDTLSQEDLVRCLEARSILSERAYRKSARLWRTPTSTSCRNPPRCAATWIARWNTAISRMATYTSPHPLPVSSSADDAISLRYSGVCELCAQVLRDREDEELRYIWQKLPGDMNVVVPEWDSSNPT
ncbi:hypothetical protein PYCCODRAFT_1420409 [Trametes coccinea BRFM310]|uniref:BTB domain-containing protein n=1 Tax=Trametes coccinea (strain BRFM310) TaxID=1353009 RepID=A0A1Y2I8K6_TRAC3|nr:hypothetical protein PYCCODRAFT_1420409 [Trametes coccinea BRFM310]